MGILLTFQGFQEAVMIHPQAFHGRPVYQGLCIAVHPVYMAVCGDHAHADEYLVRPVVAPEVASFQCIGWWQ